MKIRHAGENDASLLAELGRKTFYETFSEQNTAEDMALYLEKNFSTNMQLAEIKEPDVIFLLAELGNIPAGYAKLKMHSRDEALSGTRPIELQRIYLAREFIGRGAGAELMEASITEAKNGGFDRLWLGVWEKNERAIKFYERSGFKKVGNHIFILGTDPQNDLIMELEI